MSTLQHALQPALRNRVVVILTVTAMAAAIVTALIVSNSGSTNPLGSSHVFQASQPSRAALEQQVQASAGPRYGQVGANGSIVGRPAPLTKAELQSQIQASAGPRFGERVGLQIHR